jgi:hypothetical protein
MCSRKVARDEADCQRKSNASSGRDRERYEMRKNFVSV